MQKINLNTWNRKQTYEFYKNFDMPRYQVTSEVDVKKYYEYLKDKGISFYFGMIHLVIKTMQEITNFKYRIAPSGEVYEIEQIHPSFTDKIGGGDQFKIVNVDFSKDLSVFYKNALDKSQKQGDQFIVFEDEQRLDFVYISTMPWIAFSHITNAYNIDNKDSTPRVVWGKFKLTNGQYMMPLTVEVHHALVDGYHVGLFFNKLQEHLDSY